MGKKLFYATPGDGVLTNYPNEVRLTTGYKIAYVVNNNVVRRASISLKRYTLGFGDQHECDKKSERYKSCREYCDGDKHR